MVFWSYSRNSFPDRLVVQCVFWSIAVVNRGCLCSARLAGGVTTRRCALCGGHCPHLLPLIPYVQLLFAHSPWSGPGRRSGKGSGPTGWCEDRLVNHKHDYTAKLPDQISTGT